MEYEVGDALVNAITQIGNDPVFMYQCEPNIMEPLPLPVWAVKRSLLALLLLQEAIDAADRKQADTEHAE